MENNENWKLRKRIRRSSLKRVADEFSTSQEKASENASNLAKKKQMDSTPLRPIDRKQIPKTPFKQKSKNNELSSVLKTCCRNSCSPPNVDEKINFCQYLKVPRSGEIRDENRRSGDDEENGNFNCQATVVILNMYKTDEQLINSRAEKFVKGIKPDTDFYDIENGRKVYFMANLANKQIHDASSSDSTSRGKKKRRSYDNIECFVSYYGRNVEEPDCPLPEGTKLTKPRSKLVELVAKAIFNSPNGMLQVQQIYVALQNRYPYFRFMHKSAINSWKSSIRHALYQKWFYKVKILTGLHTDSKGCYWALNTSFTPREWEMPGQDKENNNNSRGNSSASVGQDCPQVQCSIEKCEEAIDLSIKRNVSSQDLRSSIQSELAREIDPLLPSATYRRAKRRLDMSKCIDGGPALQTAFDKDYDLLGISPLSPNTECVAACANIPCGISVLPCGFGFWDENQLLYHYQNPGAMEYFQQTAASISMENGIEHVQPCVWWENNYFDFARHSFIGHDLS